MFLPVKKAGPEPAVEIEFHARCNAEFRFRFGHSFARPHSDASCVGKKMRAFSDFIFLVLFFLILVAWLVLWAALHIAGGAIHLLLLAAVIFLVLHLFRGRHVA